MNKAVKEPTYKTRPSCFKDNPDVLKRRFGLLNDVWTCRLESRVVLSDVAGDIDLDLLAALLSAEQVASLLSPVSNEEKSSWVVTGSLATYQVTIYDRLTEVGHVDAVCSCDLGSVACRHVVRSNTRENEWNDTEHVLKKHDFCGQVVGVAASPLASVYIMLEY